MQFVVAKDKYIDNQLHVFKLYAGVWGTNAMMNRLFLTHILLANLQCMPEDIFSKLIAS